MTYRQQFSFLPATMKTALELDQQIYDITHRVANAIEKKWKTKLSFCFTNKQMARVVATSNITLVIPKDCYCYQLPDTGYLPEEDTRISLTCEKGKKLTVRKCCEALAKSVSKEEWKPCNHSYVEVFNKPDENGEVEVGLGS
jgi:hypothetical protein